MLGWLVGLACRAWRVLDSSCKWRAVTESKLQSNCQLAYLKFSQTQRMAWQESFRITRYVRSTTPFSC